MAKVLLINPPQNTRYPQPPMGLALLGAVLERNGHQVKIVDCNLYGGREWRDEIIKEGVSADMVGLTAMTPTVNSAIAVANYLKDAIPRMPIILGGVHGTLLPHETLEACHSITLVVRGEGDNVIVELAGSGIKVEGMGIQGVYQSSVNVDMDSLPYLAYHLLPWRKYRPHPPHGRAKPWLPMLTSRGCVYKCSYCCHGVFGNKFKAQSPVRVVEEIAYMQEKFGVKEIAFYDDVFTLNKDRAYRIADEMLRRNLKVCWTCETRADLVDKGFLERIKLAGCYSISYGIESGSQEILDIVGKGISIEKSEEAVRLTREAGIQTIGYFMIGSPKETPETIRKTINFAKSLKLDYAQFAITTPFPNTKLWEYYNDSNNDLNIPWENFVYASVGGKTSPMFESDALSRGDIEWWVSKAYREFYLRSSYLLQRLRGMRSVGDMRVAVEGMRMLAGM